MLGFALLVGSVSACNSPLIHPRQQLSETRSLVKAAPLWMLLLGLKGQNARLMHQNTTSMHFDVKRHHWIFPGLDIVFKWTDYSPNKWPTQGF
jgi:hypothetical protein